MGRVSRNMIGCVTVLIWGFVALWLALAAHWVAASLVGAFGLLRLVMLVKDWNKHARRR